MKYWIIKEIKMIIIILTIIIAILIFITIKTTDNLDLLGLNLFAIITTAICGLILIITIIAAIICNMGIKGELASKKETYNSLIYQATNNLYNNDNELGKKELANQIQEWNEDIALGKALQYDLWTGIFFPNIYDELETIPINLLK